MNTAQSHPGSDIRPFRVEAPEADLADLRERLSRSRFATHTARSTLQR
ncbi:MAG TPA: hypothetical protein VGZ32_01305 [Actinocrinis sp.]|nr:hypothetical protein [Actinocrinis sp.]HEV3168941.1 hypothetical protein [Actinocrinis sp.]